MEESDWGSGLVGRGKGKVMGIEGVIEFSITVHYRDDLQQVFRMHYRTFQLQYITEMTFNKYLECVVELSSYNTVQR